LNKHANHYMTDATIWYMVEQLLERQAVTRTSSHKEIWKEGLKELSKYEEGCLLEPSGRWWRQKAVLKRRSLSIRLHGATSQRTAFFILVAMRTWNLSKS
jgi:hypothetical protein